MASTDMSVHDEQDNWDALPGNPFPADKGKKKASTAGSSAAGSSSSTSTPVNNPNMPQPGTAYHCHWSNVMNPGTIYPGAASSTTASSSSASSSAASSVNNPALPPLPQGQHVQYSYSFNPGTTPGMINPSINYQHAANMYSLNQNVMVPVNFGTMSGPVSLGNHTLGSILAGQVNGAQVNGAQVSGAQVNGPGAQIYTTHSLLGGHVGLNVNNPHGNAPQVNAAQFSTAGTHIQTTHSVLGGHLSLNGNNHGNFGPHTVPGHHQVGGPQVSASGSNAPHVYSTPYVSVGHGVVGSTVNASGLGSGASTNAPPVHTLHTTLLGANGINVPNPQPNAPPGQYSAGFAHALQNDPFMRLWMERNEARDRANSNREHRFHLPAPADGSAPRIPIPTNLAMQPGIAPLLEHTTRPASSHTIAEIERYDGPAHVAEVSIVEFFKGDEDYSSEYDEFIDNMPGEHAEPWKVAMWLRTWFTVDKELHGGLYMEKTLIKVFAEQVKLSGKDLKEAKASCLAAYFRARNEYQGKEIMPEYVVCMIADYVQRARQINALRRGVPGVVETHRRCQAALAAIKSGDEKVEENAENKVENKDKKGKGKEREM